MCGLFSNDITLWECKLCHEEMSRIQLLVDEMDNEGCRKQFNSIYLSLNDSLRSHVNNLPKAFRELIRWSCVSEFPRTQSRFTYLSDFVAHPPSMRSFKKFNVMMKVKILIKNMRNAPQTSRDTA